MSHYMMYNDNTVRDGVFVEGGKVKEEDSSGGNAKGFSPIGNNWVINIKLPLYDGSSKWLPYIRQVEAIFELYKVPWEFKFGKVVEALRGKARDFFATWPVNDNFNYEGLCASLCQRFGGRMGALVARHKLCNIQQSLGESTEEFGEKVLLLAMEGFGHLDHTWVEKAAVEFFLVGLRDKETANKLLDNNYSTMYEAINGVKNMNSIKLVMGGDNIEKEGSSCGIRVINFSDSSSRGRQEREDRQIFSQARRDCRRVAHGGGGATSVGENCTRVWHGKGAPTSGGFVSHGGGDYTSGGYRGRDYTIRARDEGDRASGGYRKEDHTRMEDGGRDGAIGGRRGADVGERTRGANQGVSFGRGS